MPANPAFPASPTQHHALSRRQEPASFLTSSWLTPASGSRSLLPSAPALTLQLSDVCYDVFTLLPTMLHSFAQSGMQLPRVRVSSGRSWPPPTDADILATVPFLYVLQPLRPVSLELSGLPLYLSDASSWAPALARMTQLTRLDLKLDTWKVMPGRTLAASGTAMARVRRYAALAGCSPAAAAPCEPSSSLDSADMEHSPRLSPASGRVSSSPPAVVSAAAERDQAAQYDSWMHAKAESARGIARHLAALAGLRHLEIHSCACEWTAVTLVSLSCARHLSHLELHWIDNAQSAARHMLPAIASLLSTAFACEEHSDCTSGAMSEDISIGDRSGADGPGCRSPDDSVMSDHMHEQESQEMPCPATMVRLF